MKFESLKITNFMAIGAATLNLSDRGLLCVQGINEDDTSADSNGAGKSTLADALCWSLYGTTARGISGDAVVNREAKKGTVVEVAVRDEDDLFVIARHRKHADGKNSVTIKRIEPTAADLTKGTDRLTQQEIERVLGCSYEVFTAAIYAGQEKFPDLPALTDKSLKVLIEQAAGITLLESAYDIARADCSMARNKVDTLRTQIEKLEVQLVAGGDLEKDARKQRVDHEIRREAQIHGLKVTVVEKDKCLTHVLKEIDAYEKPGLLKEIADVKAKLDAVAGERIEERRLVDALAKADRAMTVAHSQATAIKTEVEKLKAKLDGVSGRAGTPCDECGKPYCEHDLAEAKKIATDALRGGVARFKSAKATLDTAREARQSVADALEAHRASMSDISTLNALSERLNASLRDVEDLERQSRVLLSDIETARTRIDEVTKEANPFDAMIKKCMDRLVELTEAHLELVGQKEKAGASLALAEAAVKVFSPSGARAHVLDTVTPFLNERTARYLGTLSDGRIEAAWTTLAKTSKGELREKFCIEVTKDRAGDTFAALSGGEKRKVRLATALALQDLVSERATKPIDLFIGDEVDDALDDAGLERLMGVLEEKARERGTVLVISHRSLRDWIRSTVTIVNRGGLSTLEEEAA